MHQITEAVDLLTHLLLRHRNPRILPLQDSLPSVWQASLPAPGCYGLPLSSPLSTLAPLPRLPLLVVGTQRGGTLPQVLPPCQGGRSCRNDLCLPACCCRGQSKPTHHHHKKTRRTTGAHPRPPTDRWASLFLVDPPVGDAGP